MYEKIKTSVKSLFSFSTYLAWSPFRGHQYVKMRIITFESLNIVISVSHLIPKHIISELLIQWD